MSLGDCKAPGTVADGFWVARRVGHGLIFPLGPRAWGHDEVWARGGKGSMGGVGARRPAAEVRRRRRGEAQRFILYLIKAGLPRSSLGQALPVRFRRPIAGAVGRWPEGQAGVL
jgi:hypothetical protein